MPQTMALTKGARITVGVFCALFFLHSVSWLVVDVAQLGIGGVWDGWVANTRPGPNAVTGPYTLGLAAVQLAAVFAAFAGARAAGGLLAVATILSLTSGAQMFVSTGNHTSDNRWFLGPVDQYSSVFEGVFFASAWLILFGVVAGIVLLAGMRRWPGPRPSEPPMRPAKASAAVGALVLGALVLCHLAWNVYVWVQSVGDVFALYVGRGTLTALSGLAPGWYSLTFLLLSAVGVLLSLIRGAASRGFALGLALVLLPPALLGLVSLIGNGALFELGDAAPGLMLIYRLLMVVELLGSIALLVLMGRRGEPVAAGWIPPGQAVPRFAAPGFPQAPMGGGWQPGPAAPLPYQGAPYPGPAMPPVPPQQGPPMPQQGPPPMPQQGPPLPPPPAQGGFGPPPA